MSDWLDYLLERGDPHERLRGRLDQLEAQYPDRWPDRELEEWFVELARTRELWLAEARLAGSLSAAADWSAMADIAGEHLARIREEQDRRWRTRAPLDEAAVDHGHRTAVDHQEVRVREGSLGDTK